MSSSIDSVSSELSVELADALGFQAAVEQAKKSASEGGIPIGSAIVFHSSDNKPVLLAASHNQRIQEASATLHGEIAALESAGRLKADIYKNSTIYTTLSPCSMCTGAILLFKIPRVVVGENINFLGGEDYLRSHGVQVVVRNDAECKQLMAKFIRENPEDWNEDIGE